MKKLVSLCAAVLLLFGAFAGGACQDGPDPSQSSLEEYADVWTEDGLTKILQNVDYEAPDRQTLSIGMAKNESEGAQIIVAAKKDIASYRVEISDLKSGENTIPKDDIKIYTEKYTAIEKKSNSLEGFRVGDRIPDALIPVESIVEYGDDQIVSGDNQGFYVDVKTDEDTAAGVYTGTITLTLDDKSAAYPVEVTVWDFTVDSEDAPQNYWAMYNRSEWGTPEWDASDEMAETYFEFMLDYRMNSELPFSGVGGPERYVELLRKYYHHDNFSAYRFHYEYLYSEYRGIQTKLDCNLLKDYLKAVVRASLEDKVNYLDKAFVYFVSLIDEPSTTSAFEECERMSQAYGLVLQDTDTELKMELSANPDYDYYLDTVRDTLLNIPNLLTYSSVVHYDRLKDYDIGYYTTCMQMQYANSEERRAEYAETSFGGNYWWYTCTGPINPYPSTHIDDYGVSARLIGWMQNIYGVQGYVNWNTSVHFGADGTLFEDLYTHPTIYSGGWSNGDGFILYPGRPYGIDGPVPSMRAIAFRDGMEEYSYLAEYKERMSDFGGDLGESLLLMTSELFSGTRVLVQESDLFMEVRAALANSIVNADEQDIVIGSVEFARGKAQVTFRAKSGVTNIRYGGAVLEPADGLYMLEVDLSQSTVLELSYEAEGENRTYSYVLSGEYESVLDCEEVAEGVYVNSLSSLELNTDAAFSVSGNSYKLTLQGEDNPASNVHPNFSFDASLFNGGKLSKVSSVMFSLYSTDPSPRTFSVYVFDGSTETYVCDFEVREGWNEITIRGLGSLPSSDSLSRILIRTDNFYQEGGIVYYLDAVSLLKTRD